MRVDLSETDSFDLIPAGRYQAKVTDGEIRESGPNAKHPGAEYINWEFTIQEGDQEDRKQWTNTPFSHGSHECDEWTGNALIGLRNLLAATEKWSAEELSADAFEWEIDDILGSDVTIIVNVSEYQGEDVNNVKRVKAAYSGEEASSLLS